MSLPPLSLLETHILQILKEGPIGTIALIKFIQKLRPKATKQGVYLALRNLKKEEVIVIYNKQVSFNTRWLNNMQEFLVAASRGHSGESKEDFLNLKDGERITYHFADPSQTDTFWWHALYLLSETCADQNEPAYLYNPHEWFLIERRKSELESMALVSKRRRWLLVAGGKTPLDRAVAKDFDGDRTQYYMAEKALFPKQNYYFNIVGDFLIEVWIAPPIANAIEDLYASEEKLDGQAALKLKEIILLKGRSKLSISRNKRKAEKLKKMMRKYFYIPIKQKTRQRGRVIGTKDEIAK